MMFALAAFGTGSLRSLMTRRAMVALVVDRHGQTAERRRFRVDSAPPQPACMLRGSTRHGAQ